MSRRFLSIVIFSLVIILLIASVLHFRRAMGMLLSNPSGPCAKEGQVSGGTNNGTCCDGLVAVPRSAPTPRGVCAMIPGGMCTKCHDGFCGTGENFCNCPSDCGGDAAPVSPSSFSSTNGPRKDAYSVSRSNFTTIAEGSQETATYSIQNIGTGPGEGIFLRVEITGGAKPAPLVFAAKQSDPACFVQSNGAAVMCGPVNLAMLATQIFKVVYDAQSVKVCGQTYDNTFVVSAVNGMEPPYTNIAKNMGGGVLRIGCPAAVPSATALAVHASSSKASKCGNAHLDSGEKCDLGALNGNGHGCLKNCTVQSVWTCPGNKCRKK